MTSELPEIGSLWIGGPLRYIERLCLTSMVQNGHRVTLYSYDPIEVPDGVERADAALILPRDNIFTYKKTGSYATFADWFRIEMIARTGKIWLDTDILLMAPFDDPEPYFFLGGPHRHYGDMVNNCVLKYPSASEFSRDLQRYFQEPYRLLRFVPWHSALRLSVKRAMTGKWDLSRFRWGAFGMGLLKRETARHGLEGYVHKAGSAFVEGARDIMAQDSAVGRDVSQIRLMHLITSSVGKHGLDPLRPKPGSLYEIAVGRYGAQV